MIGAAEQQAQVHAEDGHDRGQRGAQPVLDDHRPLGQALGPGGADVVLAHRLQHARPVSRAYSAAYRKARRIHGSTRFRAHSSGFWVKGRT